MAIFALVSWSLRRAALHAMDRLASVIWSWIAVSSMLIFCLGDTLAQEVRADMPFEIKETSASDRAGMKWPSGFHDGNLAQLTELAMTRNALMSKPGKDGLENAFHQITTPTSLIRLFWDISGNVAFSNASGKPRLELKHAGSTNTILSQSLLLPPTAQNLEFTMDMQRAKQNDVLEVSFSGNIIASYQLADKPHDNHISVSLAGITPQHPELSKLAAVGIPIVSGLIAFQLRGPVDSDIVVGLSEFNITSSRPNGQ